MKAALVTGASTGIGQAVAVELGRKGYFVGLVARRLEELEKTREMVKKAGGQALEFPTDLRDLEQVDYLVDLVSIEVDKLDLIVNIAGVWHGKDEVYAGKDITEFEWKVINDTYMVGVVAPTIIVAGLVNLMPRGAVIVNISGTFENGARGWLPYYVSKRAIEDLTLGLVDELKDKGIRVNCVSPSDTATQEYIKYFPEDAKDANTPEQVAKLVVDVAEKGETGKFWTIRRGQVSQGYHG